MGTEEQVDPEVVEEQQEDAPQQEEAGEGLPEEGVDTPPAPAQDQAADVLKKRINDMQAWGTRLSQKNALLESEIEKLKSGSGSHERVASAASAAETAQSALDSLIEEFSADYPEGRPVLTEIYSNIKALREELAAIKAPISEQSKAAARERLAAEFKASVQPEIMKVHPDFEEILLVKNPDGTVERNEDYFLWAATQRPTLQLAAVESGDPDDIIWALAEYKKARNMDATKADRLQRELIKHSKIAAAMAMRGSGAAAEAPQRRPVATLDDMPIEEYIAMRRKQELRKG